MFTGEERTETSMLCLVKRGIRRGRGVPRMVGSGSGVSMVVHRGSGRPMVLWVRGRSMVGCGSGYRIVHYQTDGRDFPPPDPTETRISQPVRSTDKGYCEGERGRPIGVGLGATDVRILWTSREGTTDVGCVRSESVARLEVADPLVTVSPLPRPVDGPMCPPPCLSTVGVTVPCTPGPTTHSSVGEEPWGI